MLKSKDLGQTLNNLIQFKISMSGEITEGNAEFLKAYGDVFVGPNPPTLSSLLSPTSKFDFETAFAKSNTWTGTLNTLSPNSREHCLATTIVLLADQTYLAVQNEITPEWVAKNEMLSKTNLNEKILDTMTEGFIIHNLEGEVVQFNQAASVNLGLISSELPSRASLNTDWDCLDENRLHLNLNYHPAQIVLRTGKSVRNFQLGVRLSRQKIRWLNVSSNPFHMGDAKVFDAVLTTFVDVTEQVERTERLKRNETFLTEAQSVAQIGSWSVNLQTGQIEWTDEMYRMVPEIKAGNPPTAKEFLAILHPEDRLVFLRNWNSCRETGSSQTIRIRLIGPEGIKWFEARGQGRFSNEGEVIAVHGTLQDISRRVKLEQENSLIIRSLNIGVWSYDVEKDTLIWNNKMYDLFGVSAADFPDPKQAWRDFVSHEDQTENLKLVDEAIRESKIFNSTFAVQTSEGLRYLQERAIAVRSSESTVTHLQGICWDRTLEVKLQHQLDKERSASLHDARMVSLGEMSAGVAHEINNPLTIISSSTEILSRQKGLEPVAIEKLDAIKRSISRISKIIRGLSKFAHGSTTKERKPTELVPLLEETLTLCTPRAMLKDVNLKLICGNTSLISCDQAEIQQVLINLVNNGIDAAAKSDSVKQVRILAEDIGEWVTINVSDSGAGIPEKLIPKIFDPFFTTKPAGEGTGLGLSISKGIVEDHQGTIKVIGSAPTCFQLRLPVLRRQAESA